MASAQVLPNPGGTSARKQGHLEAGKRRLEEFRKKKAEQRTKKTVSTGQLLLEDGDAVNKHSLKSEGSGNDSERDVIAIQGSSVWQNKTEHNLVADVNLISKEDVPSSADSSIRKESIELGRPTNNYEGSGFHQSISSERNNGFHDIRHGTYVKADNPTDTSTKHLNATDMASSNIHSDGVKGSRSYSLNESQSDNYSAGKYANNDFSVSSRNLSSNVLDAVKHSDGRFPSYSSSGIKDDDMNKGGSVASSMRENKISEAIFRRINVEKTSHNSAYTPLSTTTPYSPDRYSLPSLYPGSASAKSRPSFLDSLNISRASSTSHMSSTLPDLNINDLQAHQNSSSESEPPALSQQPGAEITAEPSVLEYNHEETKLELPSKRDDDFSALEQHIEDLTQEKFALKRAVETSQALAESLASENSSLTNSFNEQGKVVNQLKSDMERLQEEIKAQLLAFESLKMEYANAQLECSAADERAKILASEVINLEEKALRLRSNELKLEKRLENCIDEISSYRRKLSSLEKVNQDFQSTIEALQEEKKVLQSKIWNASVQADTFQQSPEPIKKSACTSTSDLGIDNRINKTGGNLTTNASEQTLPSFSSSDVSGPSSAYNGNNFSRDGLDKIPDDQMKMVGNIKSLISELALEKERLLQSLAAETSINGKLKDLNKELSQKLEVQTQRFELLATQNMAKENSYARPAEIDKTPDTAEYADEGDEVVERVLSWIMKLFPGGPAKRRTSKLL